MTGNLFEYAEQSKLNAIERVEFNNRDFVSTATGIIFELARERETITALDVWKIYNGPAPKHPRAIGAAFIRAHKAGWISPTNDWVKSGRSTDHNQQLRVWRSNWGME